MTTIPTGGTNWVLFNTDRKVGVPSNSVGLSYGKSRTEYCNFKRIHYQI